MVWSTESHESYLVRADTSSRLGCAPWASGVAASGWLEHAPIVSRANAVAEASASRFLIGGSPGGVGGGVDDSGLRRTAGRPGSRRRAVIVGAANCSTH